uniref:DUF668 domain-containing protein n=1 Tax=Kalanchoe fedtschenkoi TaxID=63787 RepID=A0A7N0R8V7_KALFE
MVADSWFRNLLKVPHRNDGGSEKVVIGVLAFEVAALMSKVVQLWQSLSDKQIARLRDEISKSVGIKKLVSEDDEYIAQLICAEMFENTGHIARAVVRLGKKCSDPGLKSFEHVFDDLIKLGFDPYGWEFSWKKMDSKVKKMERLISYNANLFREMETLVDLEQTLKRIKGTDRVDGLSVLDYQKRVAWKKMEVKNLKDVSLWNRTYDYTIGLLARSLFTIFSRIKHVYGIGPSPEVRNSSVLNADHIGRSESVAAVLHHPSVEKPETSLPRFSSGPLGRSSVRGPNSRSGKSSNFYSGPIGSSFSGPLNSRNGQPGPPSGSSSYSGPLYGASRNVTFFSGPLGKTPAKSGPLSGTNKGVKRLWKALESPFNNRARHKSNYSGHHQSTPIAGSLKGCIPSANDSQLNNTFLGSNGVHAGTLDGSRNSNGESGDSGVMCASLLIFSSKQMFLNTPPETLGGAALALHYANVIIVIEKLASSPHLIGHDARDDLYDMLPTSIRSSLRERLKPYSKSLASSSICDTVLADQWNAAMSSILEWLAPLAHGTIKWQSERSMEQQNFAPKTNMLLVHTLYFANQEKTEAAITELLVGLNYIWRFGRELNARPLSDLEHRSSKKLDDYLELEDE